MTEANQYEEELGKAISGMSRKEALEYLEDIHWMNEMRDSGWSLVVANVTRKLIKEITEEVK